jgi:hypothetical protein
MTVLAAMGQFAYTVGGAIAGLGEVPQMRSGDKYSRLRRRRPESTRGEGASQNRRFRLRHGLPGVFAHRTDLRRFALPGGAIALLQLK